MLIVNVTDELDFVLSICVTFTGETNMDEHKTREKLSSIERRMYGGSFFFFWKQFKGDDIQSLYNKPSIPK